MNIGYPTLLKFARHYGKVDEMALLFREGYGLDTKILYEQRRYKSVDERYITADMIEGINKKIILVKSPTGTGKSTVAREIRTIRRRGSCTSYD